MSEVVLTLRAPLDGPVDAGCVAPDRFVGLGEREISGLEVWRGSRRVKLGDYFEVRGERSSRVRVLGSVSQLQGLGTGTASGTLVVEGDAGNRVGAGMSGGAIDVHGSVGDDAGQGMTGGTLRVRQDAGDRLGAPPPGASKGMTGGEIVVTGSVGEEAGARVRRGLIAVGGDAGPLAARAMIAGTLVVLGRAGRDAGSGSKRGTLIAVGGVEIPATYTYACTYEPPHVRLTMVYLRRRYGLPVDPRVEAGRYRRYCGDAGDPGRGEILEWVTE